MARSAKKPTGGAQSGCGELFPYYATGTTPAMSIKIVGAGSAYAAAFVEAEGNPLDGAKTYKNFWSVDAI